MIVLFRFHAHYELTHHNLKILRSFTPDAVFVGLYGGNNLDSIPQYLKNDLDSIYRIPSDDPHWKWKNADLCVRQWFKDEGHKLSFGHLHLAEWDMLTLLDLKTSSRTASPKNSRRSL